MSQKHLRAQIYLQKYILFQEFNKSLEICKFPSCKLLLSTKKEIDLTKTTIVHSVFYQICEKFLQGALCKQISTFFEDILSKYQCGFRKEHSAQHCLLALIEKWKQSVDHGKAFGASLTDLSKASTAFHILCLFQKSRLTVLIMIH